MSTTTTTTTSVISTSSVGSSPNSETTLVNRKLGVWCQKLKFTLPKKHDQFCGQTVSEVTSTGTCQLSDAIIKFEDNSELRVSINGSTEIRQWTHNATASDTFKDGTFETAWGDSFENLVNFTLPMVSSTITFKKEGKPRSFQFAISASYVPGKGLQSSVLVTTKEAIHLSTSAVFHDDLTVARFIPTRNQQLQSLGRSLFSDDLTVGCFIPTRNQQRQSLGRSVFSGASKVSAITEIKSNSIVDQQGSGSNKEGGSEEKDCSSFRSWQNPEGVTYVVSQSEGCLDITLDFGEGSEQKLEFYAGFKVDYGNGKATLSDCLQPEGFEIKGNKE